MTSELPGRIPIFPLPNTVFFPGTTLPLHVFEARYRQLYKALQPCVILGKILSEAALERGSEELAPLVIYSFHIVAPVYYAETVQSHLFKQKLNSSLLYTIQAISLCLSFPWLPGLIATHHVHNPKHPQTSNFFVIKYQTQKNGP